MGHLLLPIFPIDTEFLTPTLGVYVEDGIVNYLHVGVPIFCHKESDLQSFRYITSNFTMLKMCKNTDIVRVFKVSVDSVRRWKKRLKEEGEEVFFSADERHGRSHKLIGDVKQRIQDKLDQNQSVNSIAKEEGVSEGSIRYSIKKGYLKKK
jgi:hypothetical protein